MVFLVMLAGELTQRMYCNISFSHPVWAQLLPSSPTLSTLWAIACQAPLSMGFSRQGYWNGFCHAILQGTFPTQGSSTRLLHCRWILYPLSHLGSPHSPPHLVLKLMCYFQIAMIHRFITCCTHATLNQRQGYLAKSIPQMMILYLVNIISLYSKPKNN